MSVVPKKAQEKCFLGVSSPRGHSQLKMFCVAPPFIGETNTDELEQRNTILQTMPNWPRKLSVAWWLPPGEKVGMVACFQLHQKCVLGDFMRKEKSIQERNWLEWKLLCRYHSPPASTPPLGDHTLPLLHQEHNLQGEGFV